MPTWFAAEKVISGLSALARARALRRRTRFVCAPCRVMSTNVASNARAARRRRRNAATDENADARNDIVAVEFAPDGGRERAWTAVSRLDLRPKRARPLFL